MFVAQLSPSYFPVVGGTETHVRTLTLALRKRGVTSQVITLCDTRKWESSRKLKRKTLDDVQVTVWPSYPIWSNRCRVHWVPALLLQLRRYLNGFDLLHFHDVCDLSFPLSANRIKKPRIFTCHTLFETLDFYAQHKVARRLLTSSADLYHVFSQHDEKDLRALGVHHDRIRVIPHGVDLAFFNPKDEKPPRDAVRIVWFGRIARNKGVIVLLRALNLLRNEFPNFELLVGGKIWDAQYYRELLEYKNEVKLKEVRFIGFVDDLPSFLEQGDIFVFPSLSDTFGIVNLEAMASGLPIVASSVGGLPEVVVDKETGFLIPPGDPTKLAEKLKLLITDRRLRRKMGVRGRERVESLFSIDKMSASVLDMYHELA